MASFLVGDLAADDEDEDDEGAVMVAGAVAVGCVRSMTLLVALAVDEDLSARICEERLERVEAEKGAAAVPDKEEEEVEEEDFFFDAAAEALEGLLEEASMAMLPWPLLLLLEEEERATPEALDGAGDALREVAAVTTAVTVASSSLTFVFLAAVQSSILSLSGAALGRSLSAVDRSALVLTKKSPSAAAPLPRPGSGPGPLDADTISQLP